MSHIIVTGPESTGKTTLSRQLAAHFGGIYIPEYARGYLEAAGRPAGAGDFAHLVAATQRLVAAAGALQHRFPSTGVAVQDTGIEVLKLWFEDKFGSAPPHLERAFLAQRPAAFALCRPDIPWVYDPLREDPHRRQALFVALRAICSKTGVPVVEVSGFDDSRLLQATEALRRFIV